MNETNPVYAVQLRKGLFKEDGSVLYSITTEVKRNSTYTGNSRDADYLLNLFVNNIVTKASPLEDTFSNYATIADLDLLPTDRSAAIARGLSKYRDNINVISFDNLSVASTAAIVVKDTINNIVDTYLKVKTKFVGSDTQYFPYPAEVGSLRDQYIASYKASRDARIAAEEAQDGSQYESDLAEAVRLILEDCDAKICSIYNKLAGMNTLVQIIGTKYVDTLTTIVQASGSKSDDLAGAAEQTVLTNLISYIQSDAVKLGLVYDSSFTSEIDTGGNGLTLLASMSQVTTESQVSCHNAGLSLASATAEAGNKLSDLKDKQVLKEAASQAEEAALAKLTLYCPDLDPATV
jgi:hypothetical protein